MSMQSSAQVTVLVGAQWGDEGKGKWIDVLARNTDLVVRYQGGNNAGHTLYVQGEKVVLHQIPSGIFHKGQLSALASGVVVNPVVLVGEMEKLRNNTKLAVELVPERLWPSARAHVITPWHVHLDEQRESTTAQPIGTTKRGIGPTYAEKAARTGLRLGHYVDDTARTAWVARMAESNPEFKKFFAANQDSWQQFFAAAKPLQPFVCDAEARIRKAQRQGKKILLEGAQGTLLDIDHGTYPYVTSSSTGSGGAVQSVGLSPKLIGNVIGIAKGYVTRVGEGPFPTELKDQMGEEIRQKGKEFGATTGRPRRVGWMDAVALRFVADVNGLDGIVLNKLDVMTGLKDLKIATHYLHPELGKLDELPWCAEILARCEPVYETYPGWTEELPSAGRFSDLPVNARRYVEAVERHAGVKVIAVGTGPNREDGILP